MVIHVFEVMKKFNLWRNYNYFTQIVTEYFFVWLIIYVLRDKYRIQCVLSETLENE